MPLSKCNYLIHSNKPYDNHYVLLLVRHTIGSKAYNQGPPMSQLMCRISGKFSAQYDYVSDNKPCNFPLFLVSEQHDYFTRSASAQQLHIPHSRINI